MQQEKLDSYMIQIAELTAKMSKCNRLKVGAVFERDNRPLCTGWNGLLEGISDDCCEENNKSKDSVIHAEMNALRYMAKAGISTNNSTLYITHAPCINCAKHLAGIGLKKIIYINDYKNLDGVKLLQKCNIQIEKYKNTKKD